VGGKMRRKKLCLYLLLIIILIPGTSGKLCYCKAQNLNDSNQFPVLKGPYLGQKKPGLTPEIFAFGLLSKPKQSAIGLSFTPDGNEVYYSLWGGKIRARIMFMKKENNQWTKPQIAPFSGKYMDWDLNLSPDGNKLYFNSMRPVETAGESKKDADIWVVERTENGWGEPQNIGALVNTDGNEVHPTVSNEGTLYFFARYGDGYGDRDIYRSELINGHYLKPENIGESINTEFNETDPFVAPDESYIIFQSRRSGGFGNNDLYISFRNKDGSWAKAQNMGNTINTDGNDYCGRISHDGRFFFFSIRKKTHAEFYWVDSKIIEELKPDELK